MKKLKERFIYWTLGVGLIWLASCGQKPPVIYYYTKSAPLTELGSKEVRKYIYQRTGMNPEISRISDISTVKEDAVVLVNIKDSLVSQLPEKIVNKSRNLGVEDFHIMSDDNQLYIIGGSDLAVLYGSYRYAERIGVRFYLHGDVIPDERYQGSLIHLADELSSPLFKVRGILPFHDFPEGPDWWNEADYKAYFAQMTKLRMNFFGLHTYPEGGPHAEPSLWIGLKKDISQNGDVTYSYPSTFANTERQNHWGYAPLSTGEFCAGASQLFDKDVYGADVLLGTEPFPDTQDSMNLLFNRTGDMFASAFKFGQQLGLKLGMGTETPLTIPNLVKDHLQKQGIDPESDRARYLLYEGIFTRITHTHPLDYYWLWTPEGWTWGNPTNQVVEETMNDIKIANEVLSQMNYPFELGLSGWVLGPPQDRSGFDRIVPERAPISCISRMWGQDRIERGFSKIKTNRPKWAIPWLEEDPRMTIPQFWVGRMRADAADALSYDCDGLIGIHWRTRSVAPNVRSLAEAGWSQCEWNPGWNKAYVEDVLPTEDIRIEGKANADDGRKIKGTEDSPVFNSLCYDMKSYLIKVPNGTYKVCLQFCENVYNQPGKRVFGVNVEGEEAVAHLDVFAKVGKDVAYEVTTKPIKVKDGILNIDFNIETENPFISGIVIEGMTDAVNQIKSQPFKRAINAGGIAYKEYEADLPEGTGMFSDKPRDLECLSFYKDYALSEFGKEIADSAAHILAGVDGFYGNGGNDQVKIPRPANWVANSGPGAVMPNRKPWKEEAKEYMFVDSFLHLRDKIVGKGSLQRFDYWANTFLYTKAMAKVGCSRGELDFAMEQIDAMGDQQARKQRITEYVYPLRIRMAREWEDMMNYLLQTVYTPGELGTVANLEQLSRTGNAFLDKYDSILEQYMGGKLPVEASLSKKYTGTTRVIMLTERPLISKTEKVELKAIVLTEGTAKAPDLMYRAIGEDSFRSIKMSPVSRNTFSVVLPEVEDEGIEYYITLQQNGEVVNYPATAPEINNTVLTF